MSYGGRAEEEKGRRCPDLRGDNKYVQFGSGCHGNAFLYDTKHRRFNSISGTFLLQENLGVFDTVGSEK